MSVLDFNFNFNAGVPPLAGSALRFRPRYNSDLESRLVDTTQPDQLVPPPLAGGPPNYRRFHEFWDADLRAYSYLDDFLTSVVNAATAAGNTWRAAYAVVARNGGANIPPDEMNRQQLGDEVLRILELALEREGFERRRQRLTVRFSSYRRRAVPSACRRAAAARRIRSACGTPAVAPGRPWVARIVAGGGATDAKAA
jgi:hypothetical protein